MNVKYQLLEQVNFLISVFLIIGALLWLVLIFARITKISAPGSTYVYDQSSKWPITIGTTIVVLIGNVLVALSDGASGTINMNFILHDVWITMIETFLLIIPAHLYIS